jgi:pimeloyl-ACP methyl ester carboxylesterase
VIAIDLPGFGASEMPARTITIPRYAHTVDTVCADLRVSSACVVGHSMGGFVATELALLYPSRVNALVLVAAAGYTNHYLLSRPLLRSPPAALVERALFETGGDTGRRARRALLGQIVLRAAVEQSDRLAPTLAEQLTQPSWPPGTLPAGLACARHDHRHRLAEISCPTLVVWGASDRLVTPRCADRYAASIPNARQIIYPATGHCPALERPTQFNHDLTTFLDRSHATAAA